MSSKSSTAEFFPLFLVLAVWGFAAWFSCVRYEPVPVIPASASDDVFSAERAEIFLDRLFANAEPHPAGSNEGFRQQVVREFQDLGYQVELQHSTTEATNWRYEGKLPLALNNLVITFPNQAAASDSDTPVTPIILAGHFDSHPKSPGVSDNGVSIAVCLEIARMLRERPIRGLMFILTDGEEFGMLGAQDFVDKNHFPEKPIVINIEARGTSGPSLMFETSADSGWLVDVFARTSRKPFASSLFFEIYRLLPNNTDFTIYREAGYRGMNFAFIGDVKHYHTPGDNLENLDRRSMQHHGENVWGAINEISVTDVRSVSNVSAVYFDLFGLGIVRWPAYWSIWMAVAAVGLGALLFSGMSPASASYVSTSIYGLVCLTTAILASLATGWLVQKGLSIDGALDDVFPRSPLAIELTFWLWPLVAVVGLGWFFSGRTEPCTILALVWGLWSAFAVMTSLFATGCCYLFIAPLLMMVLMALVARCTVARKDPERFTAITATCGAMAAGLIWMPMERLFYDALGFSMNAVLFGRVTLLLSSLLPVLFLLSRSRQLVVLTGSIVCAVISTLAAIALN